METKSLRTIQIFAKIGRILDMILHILSIVGLVFCIIGFVLAVTGTSLSYIFVEPEIISNYMKIENISYGAIAGAFVAGMIACASGVVVTTFGGKFFKSELEVGQPFDYMVANKLKKYGIATIVSPLVANILAQFALAACFNYYGISQKMNFDLEIKLGVGILYIVLSVVLRYGAEQREIKEVTI